MADFTRLTEYLDSLSARFGIPGCDCAVAMDGNVVFRHSAGFRDEASGTPVSDGDTYWIYSATKLFTCTAALQLIEAGELGLDDPVSRHLPEFGFLTVQEENGTIRPARTILTIRHLMSMTGGLDYNLERPALQAKLADGAVSTREIVAALAEDPLNFDPGTHFLYSLCHDVLGAVIEVVSGETLADYLKKHITDPLGMRDTTFHPSASQLARMSTQYAHLDAKGSHKPMGQGNRFRLSEDYDSGGAGLLSTVDDYIRLVAALSCGGVSADGVRILSEESVALMGTPALSSVQRQEFSGIRPALSIYSYGLGVRTLVEDPGTGVPIGEFGWDGAAGAYALVDRTNQVALFYAQQVCNSYITYQYLHPGLRDTLYSCLEGHHV